MVIALPRATLLWPANLAERLDDAARRAVLAHELAHLKRRDHWTAWLEVVVACLWWWHPVVWWARRELRHYAELACDAWVLRYTASPPMTLISTCWRGVTSKTTLPRPSQKPMVLSMSGSSLRISQSM